MNKDHLTIAIAEPSDIIRSGYGVTLKRIQGYRIHPVEIISIDTLYTFLRLHKPDVLIINPSYWGYPDIIKIKEETGNRDLKCLALLHSTIDLSLLRNYENTLGIYDSIELLKEKLDLLFNIPASEILDDSNALSQREKEIITCIVKGFTNKEIAQELFLSTHTVISHRRNISRKLEIHSTAGLTIYAIVNKLVEIEEIKKNMVS
jgi:DNA-binding CsgD family transcriptional regulator